MSKYGKATGALMLLLLMTACEAGPAETGAGQSTGDAGAELQLELGTAGNTADQSVGEGRASGDAGGEANGRPADETDTADGNGSSTGPGEGTGDEDASRAGTALTQEAPLHYVDALGEWHDTTVVSGLRAVPYRFDCLRNDESGIFYEGDERYELQRGIDVSRFQGDIDWQRVRDAGISFVIVRIGFRGYGSAGTLKADECYRQNIEGAQAAGLEVGVYFFAQAINEEEAEEEARFVLELLEGYTPELPIVYDPELIRDDEARTDDVTGEQFTRNTIRFCETIREAGYTPMIYSNMIWEADLFDMRQLEDYLIWYADYETIPQTPYDFVYWQYSEKGRVDGVAGSVDLDVRFVPRGEVR